MFKGRSIKGSGKKYIYRPQRKTNMDDDHFSSMNIVVKFTSKIYFVYVQSFIHVIHFTFKWLIKFWSFSSIIKISIIHTFVQGCIPLGTTSTFLFHIVPKINQWNIILSFMQRYNIHSFNFQNSIQKFIINFDAMAFIH